MAKKSIKDAATGGTSVFDTIVTGTPGAQNAIDATGAQNAQKRPHTGGRPRLYDMPLERINLRIPTIFKEYLQAAAYRESNPKHMVSVTEYLCKLIEEDMKKHQE